MSLQKHNATFFILSSVSPFSKMYISKATFWLNKNSFFTQVSYTKYTFWSFWKSHKHDFKVRLKGHITQDLFFWAFNCYNITPSWESETLVFLVVLRSVFPGFLKPISVQYGAVKSFHFSIAVLVQSFISYFFPYIDITFIQVMSIFKHLGQL